MIILSPLTFGGKEVDASSSNQAPIFTEPKLLKILIKWCIYFRRQDEFYHKCDAEV